MLRNVCGVFFAFLFVNSSASHSGAVEYENFGLPARVAVCKLGKYGTAAGFITFSQASNGGPTYITGIIGNVTPGKHGWHVHESGITEGENPCGSAGGHFNPLGQTHGGPNAKIRHFGDLGNFRANMFGSGVVSITDHLVSLVGPADRSVIGRTLVIHAGEDDLGLGGNEESLKTGNAGARVGCCEIQFKI